MQAENITSRQIFELTMQRVAPLPCQEAYARNLAKIMSMHINRNKLIDEGWQPDELPSMSAIVVAPTGQGKTYLIRKMAEALGQNLITIDGSSLVGEGYKGSSLSQRMEAAMEAAPSEAIFARSIIFVDEVDKLRHFNTENDRVNGMSSLLQLFNSGTIAVETTGMGRKTVNVDVSRFTILMGGAFVGLEDIIRERLCPNAKIGFSIPDTTQELTNAMLLEQATLEDISEYGLIPELLGRIGSVLAIRPMELEDYRQLLTAESGSLKAKYQTYLRGLYGVAFEIADSGVELIAAKCMEASTGARAATPIVNEMMREAIAAVEDEETICQVILDADENGCCIRYGHGPREPVFSFADRKLRHEAANEAEAKLPVHTVKSNNREACVRTLLRYYRNAGGDLDALPALRPFLELTVRFVHRRCKPSEFTLLNLTKLAEAVQKNRKSGKSPYDIIMSDVRYDSSAAFQEFSGLYNIWTARELVKALNTIRDYLYEKHGPCQVRFVIPKSK